jgi:hypothetical protein
MIRKPWREVAVPHGDVLKWTFQQAEFWANLSRLHDGTPRAVRANCAVLTFSTNEFENGD